MQYVVLLAIICYGAGLSVNRRTGDMAIPNLVPEGIVDAFAAYPEGIGYMVVYGRDVEYWLDVLRVFEEREKTEPSIIGTIILEAQEEWTTIDPEDLPPNAIYLD